MAFLVSYEIAFEGKFHPTFAFDRFSTELLVVSQININMKSLVAFLAYVFFLAF